MADENSEPQRESNPICESEFNLEFITTALGLLPIKGGGAAINIGAIVDLEKTDSGWKLRVHGDVEYAMSEAEMAELQRNIQARAETAKQIQKETLKTNLRLQAEAAAELNRGVQTTPPGMIVGPNKRFRQQ